MISDLTYWLYMATGTVCLFGTGLFILGWIRSRKAHPVYINMIFILASVSINGFVTAYVRYLYCICGGGSIEHTMSLESWMWRYRMWFVLLSFAWMVGHMTARYIKERKVKR